LLKGTLPDLHTLKVFGSLVFASTLLSNRTKLTPRARKCIFLGYKAGVKGAILLDINNKEILVSRNISHHEHILPYKQNSQTVAWNYHPITINIDPTSQVEPQNINNSPQNSETVVHTPLTSQNNSDTSAPIHIPPFSQNRPIRQRKTPPHLADYVNTAEPVNSGTLYPLNFFHSLTHLSPSHKAFSTSITHCTEPQTYQEASKSECWVLAMKDELETLERNGTWSIVDLP
jgi:hypothetical protein